MKRVVIMTLLLAGSFCYGTTYFVNPGDLIQDAINSAIDSDTIIVSPGTYNENISFLGKNIILKSTNPVSLDVVRATIINGGFSGSVVTFAGTETPGAEISGFTITGGAAPVGGGIYGNYSKATVNGCIIRGNAAGTGGGIGRLDGVINNSIIENNVSLGGKGNGGGGIGHSWNADIRNSIIRNNHAAYVGGGLSGIGSIKNSLIVGNSADWNGGTIDYYTGTIENSTISENSGPSVLYNNYGSILNSIIWNYDNNLYGSGTPDITYSIIEGGYEGIGNIADPPILSVDHWENTTSVKLTLGKVSTARVLMRGLV